MYDADMGWKGVPGGKAQFVTENSSVWLAHNRQGFRDSEHDYSAEEKPAIVFLGDSFTWGYEVASEEMFVNRLRDMFPAYEVFNLAHRGYGTDQSLLTFMRYGNELASSLVVLMFSDNDVSDNNAEVRYRKPKPKFQIVNNQLVLTGVPVPTSEAWTSPPDMRPDTWKMKFGRLLFHSHFLHDVNFRIDLLLKSREKKTASEAKTNPVSEGRRSDLTLTSRILEELRDNVERSDSRLLVVFIPAKNQIAGLDDSMPYQDEIADLCRKLGIEHLDLAPMFKSTWLRTYYRVGSHWNSRGHEIAATALVEYLNEDLK